MPFVKKEEGNTRWRCGYNFATGSICPMCGAVNKLAEFFPISQSVNPGTPFSMETSTSTESILAVGILILHTNSLPNTILRRLNVARVFQNLILFSHTGHSSWFEWLLFTAFIIRLSSSASPIGPFAPMERHVSFIQSTLQPEMAIESNRVEPSRVSNSNFPFETRLSQTRTEQRSGSTRTRLNRTEQRPFWTRIDRTRIEQGLCSTRLDWTRSIYRQVLFMQ